MQSLLGWSVGLATQGPAPNAEMKTPLGWDVGLFIRDFTISTARQRSSSGQEVKEILFPSKIREMVDWLKSNPTDVGVPCI